jgi:predicted enzyme related to lactoylglutathione lyase
MVTCGNATVFISDMNAAIRFYTETLGMNLKEHYGDHWATLDAGGFLIGLHPAGAQQPGVPGSIVVGLVVEDIEAGAAKLAAGGARNVGPVKSEQAGSFLHFEDPDGNRLYLWQMPKWG